MHNAAPAHTRILTSVLSGLEHRTLAWLASRMPPWVNSDHLTALALVAMIGAGLSYVLSAVTPVAFGLVGLCLAINWFGDSLDGTLARVRQQQRPRYGYYVDHIVDAFGMVFLIGGMAVSGVMAPVVALGFLAAYFLMSIEVYLSTYSLGEFRLTYAYMGPTELRVVLALGTLALAVHPTVTVFGRTMGLFNAGGVVATAGLAVVLVVTTIGHTRQLYRAEPLPPRPGR